MAADPPGDPVDGRRALADDRPDRVGAQSGVGDLAALADPRLVSVTIRATGATLIVPGQFVFEADGDFVIELTYNGERRSESGTYVVDYSAARITTTTTMRNGQRVAGMARNRKRRAERPDGACLLCCVRPAAAGFVTCARCR